MTKINLNTQNLDSHVSDNIADFLSQLDNVKNSICNIRVPSQIVFDKSGMLSNLEVICSDVKRVDIWTKSVKKEYDDTIATSMDDVNKINVKQIQSRNLLIAKKWQVM